MEELDEAHAALGQAPRQNAVGGVACPACATSGPYISNVDSGSFERSVSSGTEVCMRYAISYCAMRVAISGS